MVSVTLPENSRATPEFEVFRPVTRPKLCLVIFKAVGEGRPYPDHGLVSPKDWRTVSPRVVRLDELVTIKRTLDLDHLLIHGRDGAECPWTCTYHGGDLPPEGMKPTCEPTADR